MADSKIPVFREARKEDFPQIIHLLLDDELGEKRESFREVVESEYVSAFHEIEKDPNNEILVGTFGSQVVAVLQMTFIPNLTLKGTKRALIEGVRVASSRRGQGIGKLLFDYALERARQRDCGLAQLTTNKSRSEAIRFYETIGFKATHEGLKLAL